MEYWEVSSMTASGFPGCPIILKTAPFRLCDPPRKGSFWLNPSPSNLGNNKRQSLISHMHSIFKTSLSLLALGAVLLTPAAHAQLLLTGNVTGVFTDSSGGNTTVVNGPGGSFASFTSGIPEHAWESPTKIEFTQKNFVDIGPGLVATDLFKVTNGRNWLGSTADSAHFNLWLTLTAPTSHSGLLTAIPFTIENTPNGSGNVNDNYTISSSPIAPFMVDNYRVQFTFSAPANITIAEKQSAFVGDLYVNFTPVPEPSTYAAIGAALLVGMIGFRTVRRRNAAQLTVA